MSGLPRSGTSLIMQMLQAGGMVLLSDDIRQPDKDNPRGYFEFELVKQLRDNQEWVSRAQGKAVKVISELLQYLPPEFKYKIIFVERNLDEILASQRKMLIRRKKPIDHDDDAKLKEAFEKHLTMIKNWLRDQSNIEVLSINYNDIIKNPPVNVKKINGFLGHILDESAMVETVDEDLYRSKIEHGYTRI